MVTAPICFSTRRAVLLLMLLLGSVSSQGNGNGDYMFSASAEALRKEESTTQSATSKPSTTTTAPPVSSTSTTTNDANNEFLGIPGTTQTTNGYDTALGNDPICWSAMAANQYENHTTSNNNAAQELARTVFPNPLVEDFILLGQTEILKDCPRGNLVRVQKPIESLRGERLRTLRYYNYTLQVEIDVDTLAGDYIMTDDGTATLALQVVVCSLGKSGFCSPFVHEQANLRDAIEKNKSGEELVVTKKKVKGNLHGGTHIHSPWVYLDMGTNRTIQQNVTVPMIVNIPGDYFVIGTVQLYTGVNGTVAYRWDISNALDAGEGRYVLYQAPAEIQEVSNGVLYTSYVAISLSSAVILFLIFQTIYHREEQVLQLSQADFLIVFLFCALLATICSFLLEPKNDVYCMVSYPLILIPIQLMYAITVGRLWRIHAVISPLLLEHLNKGKPGLTQRFVEAITYISFQLNNLFIFKKQNKRRRSTISGSVKQQISQFQLALVVGMFALPQVILQFVALIVQTPRRIIQFNSDESVGRATCSPGVGTAQSLITYGFLLLLMLVIILLVMAHSSRKLPSLFNETHVIYDSTFLSIVLLCMGGAVIALTDNPNTSPDVEYLVTGVLILSVTLITAVRIMIPKLKMVWKGDVVIVSKLVTDHHRKTRQKNAERSSLTKDSVMHGVSGFDPSASRLGGDLPGGGDYDMGQTNKLMHTIHSNSAETGLMGNPMSSMASSEYFVTSASEQFNNDHSSNNDHSDSRGTDGRVDLGVSTPRMLEDPLDVVTEEDEAALAASKEMRKSGKAPEQASSTELLEDLESGGSAETAAAAAKKAQHDEADQDGGNHSNHRNDTAVAMGDNNDDAAKQTPTAAEGAPASDDEEIPKPTFLEQRTSGFLRSAMAQGITKGLSSFGLSTGSLHTSGHDRSKSPKRRGASPSPPPKPKSKPKTTPKKKKLANRIVVSEDETPARRLVLKMLDLQDQLEEVNNKIMSGIAVTQEDWTLITKLTSKLDRTFNDEVEFEWDIEQQYKESLRDALPSDMKSALCETPTKPRTPKRTRSGGSIPIRGSGVGTGRSVSPGPKDSRMKGILRKTQSSRLSAGGLGGSSHHSAQSAATSPEFAGDDDDSVTFHASSRSMKPSSQIVGEGPTNVEAAPPAMGDESLESFGGFSDEHSPAP